MEENMDRELVSIVRTGAINTTTLMQNADKVT